VGKGEVQEAPRQVKAGDLAGFSIGGSAVKVPVKAAS
jgi:hypothetical protein